VRVHPPEGGAPRPEGIGLFVRVLAERLPRLPVEDEARLQDPALRERFVDRILAHARSKGVRLDPALRRLMLRDPA
jgi:hypothetical protein